ncbi:hypothetical protein PTE30175_04045 [Pandoraea terrae]|uniref:DUF4148 domain-containing protein n=1 Tax=Pandoraea terrae TaxID=1537710 RepID=A0A5E4XWH6_9BURK|nr:DUF4148 domain-containing protein [Pandoraea terrae]VVE40734.1 hypothetical protein PTE30175_04045 [Pandoraea terrae]
MKHSNLAMTSVCMALMVCAGATLAADGIPGGSLPGSEIDQLAGSGGRLTRAQVQTELEQAQAQGLIGHSDNAYPQSPASAPPQKLAEPQYALPPARTELDRQVYDRA